MFSTLVFGLPIDKMENTNKNMGYPQPYYPQQGNGYPDPTSANYQPPPPHQQVVMSNQPMAPVVMVGAPSVSMTGAIVLSCFAFWCCGWVFGLIAFILASK